VEWIYLAQGKGKLMALFNTVMNLRGTIKMWGVPQLVEELLASQERVCSVELV
jgi:hypothetical protein